MRFRSSGQSLKHLFHQPFHLAEVYLGAAVVPMGEVAGEILRQQSFEGKERLARGAEMAFRGREVRSPVIPQGQLAGPLAFAEMQTKA